MTLLIQYKPGLLALHFITDTLHYQWRGEKTSHTYQHRPGQLLITGGSLPPTRLGQLMLIEEVKARLKWWLERAGADAWWSDQTTPRLPPGFTCAGD